MRLMRTRRPPLPLLALVGACHGSTADSSGFSSAPAVTSTAVGSTGTTTADSTGTSTTGSSTFSCVAKVGVNGRGQLGEALTAAMQKGINGPGGCNDGDYDDITRMAEMFPYGRYVDTYHTDYATAFEEVTDLVEAACAVFVPG